MYLESKNIMWCGFLVSSGKNINSRLNLNGSVVCLEPADSDPFRRRSVRNPTALVIHPVMRADDGSDRSENLSSKAKNFAVQQAIEVLYGDSLKSAEVNEPDLNPIDGSGVDDAPNQGKDCATCSNSGFVQCTQCNGLGHLFKENSEYAFFCDLCCGKKKLRCSDCGGKCYMCTDD
mmetsp:Transcript_8905/g.16055  ORF Transcript_8905/g.16055 Transcript_8905/m.16055 type:complete len:176 (-) Transcript_8905:86-613(-)